MTYKQQLLRQEWKAKRAEILTRDKNCCTQCGNYDYLQVHHTYYISGNLAWEYPNEALITLCKTCHTKEHKTTKIKIVKSKTKSRLTNLERLTLKKENCITQRQSLLANAKMLNNPFLIELYSNPSLAEIELDNKIIKLNSIKIIA